MKQTTFAFLGVLAWLALACVAGLAQTTTATVTGLVTDESGAVLPGAQITVANTATGLKRSVTTDGAGRFVAPQLSPGPYEVSVTAQGFDTLIRTGITLEIGQSANLTLAMKVGAVSEQVTVTGEAPLVNTSSSSVAGVVDQRRIEELPLNGRDFSQLPLIQPGVTAVRNADTTLSKGYGARISMGGSRADQTAWLLDGTNIHSPSFLGTPGGAAGVMLGVDAVREFQVLTSNYSADVGGTSGGVVNMVSKSGTNDIHGTTYYNLRNSAFDARNFFDAKKQPFKRNQFGFSVGGPIRKDQTFFFGNYESVIQRLGLTLLPFVPDENAHRGVLPTGAVTVAPSIRPYLDLYPIPHGVSLGNGLAQLNFSGSNPVDEHFFVARVDHHISEKQSIFTRFTFDQGSITTPDPVPVTKAVSLIHTRFATVQHDYVLSPQLLMSTRLAGNRTLLGADEVPLADYSPSLNILLPGYLPTLGFTGATNFGPNTQNILAHSQNLYDAQENLQYIRGGHVMKFGVQIQHVGSNRRGGSAGLNGSLVWSTIQNFLTDQRLQTFTAAAPGIDNARSYVQYFYGTYFQDDWKMSQRLTWNFGLRYEPFTDPGEKHGRVSTIDDWTTATAFQTNIGLFHNGSKKSFSPRVGFAWDPSGSGKTAIRSGFGIFFSELLSSSYVVQGQKNPPYFATTATVLGNLASARSDVAQIAASLLNPTLTPISYMEITQWKLNPAYEMKFNLTVERQLRGDVSVAVGYLGDRGVHLWRNAEVNAIPAISVGGRQLVVAGGQRINRNVGIGTTRYSDAQSFYNALQFEVKKRFSRGFQFQSAYTWSKNIDDATTGVANTDYNEGTTSQPYLPKVDRGLSALHHGQNLVINGVFNIPSVTKSGALSAIAGGWQLSSIVTASSGTPFTPKAAGFNAPDGGRTAGNQHVDILDGRKNSNIVSGTTTGCGGPLTAKAGQKLGTPDLYYDPCAFALPPTPVGYPTGSGYYGNGGRNILIGPGILNFDLSLRKGTPLGFREGARIDFTADFFNLFNRANFGIPANSVLNAANRAFVSGAGRITKTTTSSRQLQFGLKIVF